MLGQQVPELLSARFPRAIRVLGIGEADLVAGDDKVSQKRTPHPRKKTTRTNETISACLERGFQETSMWMTVAGRLRHGCWSLRTQSLGGMGYQGTD